MKIGGQAIPPRVLLLAVSESALILAGFLVAISLRCLRSAASASDYYNARTIATLVVAAAVCGLMFYYRDACHPKVFSDSRLLPIRALQGLGGACLILGSLYSLQPRLSPGRGIVATAVLAILALLLCFRFVLQVIGSLQRTPTPLLVVGTAPAGMALVEEIRRRPEFDIQVVGLLQEDGSRLQKTCAGENVLGLVCSLEETIKREQVTHVVVAVCERREGLPLDLLLRLKFHGLRIEDAYSCFERVTGRILLEQLVPSSLIFCDGFHKPTTLVLAKRATDLLISCVLLPLALPVMALVAAAIWLETGAPVLFLQKRVGRLQRPFTILKFRSMQQTAAQDAPCWTGDQDVRITRVGKLIRRYRLDEFPQLFNVLRGEMSLVGPRPEQPDLCALLERHIPLFPLRHSVLPGITGWAQVKYRYGSNLEDSKTKLEHDLFYIKHMSIPLDLIILFETAKVMLLGKGAK